MTEPESRAAPYSPLIVAAALLGVGGVLAMPAVRGPLGLALDDSWQLVLIHAEVVLAPLLFMPYRGRTGVFANLAGTVACWAAGAAVVMLFTFAAVGDVAFESRALSAAVWVVSGGTLSLAARKDWIGRARILLLCAFGLPPLWHYLALEYGGATATHLRALSPNWQLAAGDVVLWPLLLIGALSWIIAFVLPERRTE
jgi:hypothetical protein